MVALYDRDTTFPGRTGADVDYIPFDEATREQVLDACEELDVPVLFLKDVIKRVPVPRQKERQA